MKRIVGPLVLIWALLVQPLNAAWQSSDSVSLPVIAIAGNQWNVRGTSDGRSGAILVWQDRRDGIADKLFAQRVDAMGNLVWPATGIQLSLSSGFQYYPQVVPDGNGGAFVVWEDNRSGSDYDIYAQHISTDGALLWSTGGAVVCNVAGHQYNPTVIPDGIGGIVVAWQDRRTGQYDIYAQHLDNLGNPTWTATGQAICTAGGDQLDPQITTDQAGGAYIAWTDYRASTTYPDIYAMRIAANGSLQWSLDGVSIVRAANTQWHAQLVSDGFGGVICAWEDRRSGTVDQVYLQRMDASANPLWDGSGVAACTAQGIQYNQQVVADGEGGAFVAWQDNRGGSDYDIYAQHVASDGSMEWPAIGRAICVSPGQQYNPSIAFDNGALLIAWQDKRNGSNYQVFAQSLDTDGKLRWNAGGQVAQWSNTDELLPVVVGDGSSGAICAWTDFRNGGPDVFAQRIGANGKIGGGRFRSFVQSDYAQKAVVYYSRTKGAIGLPNTGNLRDSLFKRLIFPDGILIGIDRTDRKKDYGWLNYNRSMYVRAGLPQVGAPRPFDRIGTRKFAGLLRNPNLTRYNNHLVGELLTLKLNIAASDNKMIPEGFGDLVFNDFSRPDNPLNRRSLRSVVSMVDSALTQWEDFSISYALLDSTLASINGAFAGPIDTVGTRALQFKPVRSAFETSILAPGISNGVHATVVSAPPRVAIPLADDETLERMTLLQNYPNPFNPSTQIEFNLQDRSVVTLGIFNLLGQEVARPFDQSVLEAGLQSAVFDGSLLASGTYFYRLTIADAASGAVKATVIRKMNLVK